MFVECTHWMMYHIHSRMSVYWTCPILITVTSSITSPWILRTDRFIRSVDVLRGGTPLHIIYKKGDLIMPAGLAKWNKCTYDCAYISTLFICILESLQVHYWPYFKQLAPGKINGHNTINKHWNYWLLVFWCDVSLTHWSFLVVLPQLPQF